jgi:hypothetical protein
MVKFQVMETFPETIEVLENFPCQDKSFLWMIPNMAKIHRRVTGHSGQMVQAVACYPNGLDLLDFNISSVKISINTRQFWAENLKT